MQATKTTCDHNWNCNNVKGETEKAEEIVEALRMF
jgi:hypothetical protein